VAFRGWAQTMKCEKSVGKIPAGVRKELLIYKIILNR